MRRVTSSALEVDAEDWGFRLLLPPASCLLPYILPLFLPLTTSTQPFVLIISFAAGSSMISCDPPAYEPCLDLTCESLFSNYSHIK